MEYGDEKLTYEQLLLQCVSPDHFSRDVLSLFDDSASQLTHAKVQYRLVSATRCGVSTLIHYYSPTVSLPSWPTSWGR